jgi:ornithine cyclodeaminase/alanine dehydrogenase-like protein (mu-crystallin family)
MKLRVLSAADVRAAVDMPAAIDAMRQAFAALADGRATVPLRLALETEHGVSLFMPAHLKGGGVRPSANLADPVGHAVDPVGTGAEPEGAEHAAAKVVSVNPGNAELGLPSIHAVVLVLDPLTGRPLALMDGTWLTALRTGAAGGLAADLLAREDATTVALFGAGVQARTQLEAVRCVRAVEEVRIVSLSGTSAEALAHELEGLEARRVDDEAVAGADIVIAATSSATPVFHGARVEGGTHVTGVGSYTTEMREVDTELILRARVIVDQREAVLAEAGDIAGPIADGAVDESVMAAEIGEVVLGRAPGRIDADEITYFKSVGNAVQDVAVAARALEAAEREGLGTVLEL